MQLNIIYMQEGLIRMSKYYDEKLPFNLVLENPMPV